MGKNIEAWSVCLKATNEGKIPSVEHWIEFNKYSQHWVFQKEKCPTSGRDHYQGRMKFEKGVTKETILTMCAQAFDEEIAQFLTVSPESNKSRAQGGLSFYCLKDETRAEGPWSDKPVQYQYKGEDLECMKTPFPWQKKVLDMIDSEPDDRTINWIYDEKGNHGRSKLVKYLLWKKKAARVPMGTATQLKTNICKQGKHRCYLVDIPRKRRHDKRIEDIVSAIEEVKNGSVRSAMYGANDKIFMDPPHVFIFSNQYPPFEHCSGDRWKCFRVEGTDMTPVQVTIDKKTGLVAQYMDENGQYLNVGNASSSAKATL